MGGRRVPLQNLARDVERGIGMQRCHECDLITEGRHLRGCGTGEAERCRDQGVEVRTGQFQALVSSKPFEEVVAVAALLAQRQGHRDARVP